MDLRNKVEKVVLFLTLAGAVSFLVWFGSMFLKSDYRQFVEDRDQKYYSELARALDLIIAQHPMGTNTVIRISGSKLALPKIVRDLEVERITISSNRIHLMVGVGRGGFGISWESQEEQQTNSWAMNTFAESLHRVVYVETR